MILRRLTVTELIVPVDHALGLLPGNVKPLAGVGQILVLDGQVFGQYALAVGQPVGVRAEQPIPFVLVLVVTVARREYVVVELHHGYDAGVQQILGARHPRIRVLPYPRQHVGAVDRHVGHHPEPFLRSSTRHSKRYDRRAAAA